MNETKRCFVPNATHVVVGIGYGGHAYCAPSKEIVVDDDLERARERVRRILLKMWFCVQDSRTVVEFMKELDQEGLQLQTQFYADFQSDVYETEISFAYQQILNTIEKAKVEPVPITIYLLPLKHLFKGGFAYPYHYRTVASKTCVKIIVTHQIRRSYR